jgi:hypothetical protein
MRSVDRVLVATAATFIEHVHGQVVEELQNLRRLHHVGVLGVHVA